MCINIMLAAVVVVVVVVEVVVVVIILILISIHPGHAGLPHVHERAGRPVAVEDRGPIVLLLLFNRTAIITIDIIAIITMNRIAIARGASSRRRGQGAVRAEHVKHLSLSLYLSISLSLYIYLSLSLYIYIYMYRCIHMYA